LLLILALALSIALIPPPSLLDQLPIAEQLQWVIDH
jgi:hypothetical protein